MKRLAFFLFGLAAALPLRATEAVESARVRLETDSSGAASLFLREGGAWRRVGVAASDAPLATLVIDGREVVFRGFRTRRSSASGLDRLARSAGPEAPIEQRLRARVLPEDAGAVLVEVTYRNMGQRPLRVQALRLAALTLDAPGDVWAFHGVGQRLSLDNERLRRNVFRVEPGLSVDESTEELGGLPLVDVWTRQRGLAIAHADTRARIIRLGVSRAGAGGTRLTLERRVDRDLPPGGTLEALPVLLIAHTGDYFQPLRTYGRLMAARGLSARPSPPLAYEPFWCNWGYRFDWTLQHGLDRLDTLRSLGIRVVTIDDGWFPSYGDWQPLPAKFPNGASDMRAWVDRLHAAGLKVNLWWVPGIAGPALAAQHPEWLLRDAQGHTVPTKWKDSLYLCPSLPEVRALHRELTRRFLSEWDYDGFKMDGIYAAPPCHAAAHHHADPEESFSDYPLLYREIQEEASGIKPDAVLGQCPCGAFANFFYLPYGNRPVAADPPDRSITTRERSRAYKALLGDTYAVDNDFHENYNEYFPAEVGVGGVISTKFTRIADLERGDFQKWFGLSARWGLAEGEYLPLYDLAFDDPETHVVRKGVDLFYFLIRRDLRGPNPIPWSEDRLAEREQRLREFREARAAEPARRLHFGFRGLEPKRYDVFDLESGERLGVVSPPSQTMDLEFRDHRWLRLTPSSDAQTPNAEDASISLSDLK